MNPRFSLLLSLCIIFCVTAAVAQKSPSSEDDLRKQAEKLFEKENYLEAAPMYSQLLSLYPRDAVYNYRYGVSLLLSGLDKTGAATYLEAATKSKEMDPDVNFYLGRSFMYSDHFNEAINLFNHFKKTGSTAKQNKLQPDIYIRNCENAITLRKDWKNVVVMNKSKVSRPGFFAAYDFTDAAGKMLTTPDRFLSPVDKDKMSNPVMFMTRGGETIYYASYGKKGDHGKDIYRIDKLPNGTWSDPVSLGAPVNSDANEDYPYLDKDGRTLYFCSDGPNSIGGYDIFKSQYDFNTGRWSVPVNIGMPVNTVDDDIFYMPSTKGETAIYSTAINCESGKIELRNIKLGNAVSNLAVISGRYFSQDQVTRRDARISVVRTKDNGIVTSVKTNQTGDYELILPTGDEYMLIVEGGSYLPHTEIFSVPPGQSLPVMKQRVMMNRLEDREEMTMTNYFSPEADPTVMEKPTQVAKSEFDVRDTANNVLQPITFEGKILFVIPPSTNNLKTSDIDFVAPSGLPQNVEVHDSAAAVAENDSQQVADEGDETQYAGVEGNNEDTIAEETKPEPVVSEKTSNAELVKMAFEESLAGKEEAKVLRESAARKKIEAASLDSLSKEQVKHANVLLAAGDKEQSMQEFRESQQNALDAIQRYKEAESLESEADAKDADSESSAMEATQLMKAFKVDTSATAYRTIGKKTNRKQPEAAASKDKENKISIVPPAEEYKANEPAAVSEKTEKPEQLNDEAAELMNKSLENEQLANNTTDTKQKKVYEIKANDLKKQSERKKEEAAKETAQPVAGNDSVISSEQKNIEPAVQKTPVVTPEQQENAVAKGAAEEKIVQIPADTTNEISGAVSKQEPVSISEPEAKSDVAINTAPASKPETTREVITPAAVTTPVAKTAEKPVKTPEAVITSFEGINVDPVAKSHYQNYQAGLAASKKKEEASKETEARLLMVNTKERRDSLEAKTADLRNASISDWQAAQQELALAKQIDPEIEEKAATAEKSAAGVATSVSPSVENNAGPDNVSVPERNKEAANSTMTAESEPSAEEVTEVLDTTRPEYPRYVETRKEIMQKQSETVDYFVGGMQQAKEARAIKENEMKFRDQAAVAKNKKEKAKLTEKADSLAMEAEIKTNHSKEMLAIAQKNTGTVKELTAKSEQLKSALVVNNVQAAPAAPIAKTETPVSSPKGQPEIADMKLNPDSGKNIPSAKTITTTAVETPADSINLVIAGNENQKDNQEDEVTADTAGIHPEEQAVAIHDGENDAADTDTTREVQAVVSAEQTKTENKQIAAVPENMETGVPAKAPASEDQKKEIPAAPTENTPENVTAAAPAETTVEKSAGNKPLADVTAEENVPATTTNVNTELHIADNISESTTFSLAKGESYSVTKKIPMDPVLPEGLVFKVQIGAFRKPLPDNTFGNLQPLSGETSRPGWIRYCLGLFRTFEPANLLKKEVRAMGYKDAFVVAYYNGKRIPLFDAYDMISKANAPTKESYAAVAEKEFKHLEKYEIKESSFDTKPDEDAKAFYGTAENVPADLVEYAVQVGVYKSSRTPSALNALLPLNTEQMPSGLFRFTTGRFMNRASADSMKLVAVGEGVKDAFVVIYRGGKKATPNESRQILSGIRAASKPAPSVSAGEKITNENVQPAVTAPSISPQDVIFKVQLGAFRENIPFNTVQSFLLIADKGISQETDDRGLHLFYAGELTDYKDALALRAEIVSKGLKDAFIVAFVKGKRTSAEAALKLLNGN